MKKLLLIFMITINSITYSQGGLVDLDDARQKTFDKDFVGAVELLNRGIVKEKSTDNLIALYKARAYNKFKLKDYYGCVADYTKAENLGASVDNELLLNRAESKNELKDYRGAIKDYDYYLKKNGFNSDITALGSSLFNLSEEQQEKQKENIKQRYSYVYLLRGNTKFNMGDFIGAKEDYEIIIKYINPEYAQAYSNRGLVKIKLKQINNACLDFSRAGELGLVNAYEMIKTYCN